MATNTPIATFALLAWKGPSGPEGSRDVETSVPVLAGAARTDRS
jgi:hypothetical protein